MLNSRDPGCKAKLFGMVGFIFVSGMVAGAISYRLLENRFFPHLQSSLSAESKSAAMEHFYRELELNEQQARSIESILDEFIMQQADLMSRYQTSRTSGQDRIQQILNDDQRKRWKKVLDELQTQQQH